jgi:hypothetical protein
VLLLLPRLIGRFHTSHFFGWADRAVPHFGAEEVHLLLEKLPRP